jgi:hypothetical protein
MQAPNFEHRMAALTDAERRLYGRLSLPPNAAVDVAAAAALTGGSIPEARRHLDALVDAGLVRCRYSLHDPAADRARRINDETDTAQERHAAHARLIEQYLRMVAAAQLAINPGRWFLGRYLTQPPAVRLDAADAVALLDEEFTTIVELQRLAYELDVHREVWELTEALGGLFNRRKKYPASVDMHERGLASAQILQDRPAQALMYIGIAQANLGQRAYGSASVAAATAAEIAREAGHHLAESSALEALGTVSLATGQHGWAHRYFSASRQIHIDLERPRGIALMTRHLGEVALAVGDLAEARTLLNEALDHFASIEPDQYHRARALLFLARTDMQAGDVAAAEQSLYTIVEIADSINAPIEHANALTELATLAEAHGEPLLARRRRESAYAFYAEAGSPQAAVLRAQLDG